MYSGWRLWVCDLIESIIDGYDNNVNGLSVAVIFGSSCCGLLLPEQGNVLVPYNKLWEYANQQ